MLLSHRRSSTASGSSTRYSPSPDGYTYSSEQLPRGTIALQNASSGTPASMHRNGRPAPVRGFSHHEQDGSEAHWPHVTWAEHPEFDRFRLGASISITSGYMCCRSDWGKRHCDVLPMRTQWSSYSGEVTIDSCSPRILARWSGRKTDPPSVASKMICRVYLICDRSNTDASNAACCSDVSSRYTDSVRASFTASYRLATGSPTTRKPSSPVSRMNSLVATTAEKMSGSNMARHMTRHGTFVTTPANHQAHRFGWNDAISAPRLCRRVPM
mmetsp:Transcript_11841/g.37603  ORF Transcript_11841/g.37603 Transcript_11841/m.37603 type:complete len:270 (-) Transcript_11841:265-1074(-)